jgi:hypothetical protein
MSAKGQDRPFTVGEPNGRKTGMNRVTAQKLTADTRKAMHREREDKARRLLRQRVSKQRVAQMVGLSPSRISAMFKGRSFPSGHLSP